MSDEYQSIINRSGEALLKAIYSLLQITKIHQDNNDLLLDAVSKFVRLIKKLDDDHTGLDLLLSEGRFYYQSTKLALRPANAKLFNNLVRFFEEREIFGIHFQPDRVGGTVQTIVSFFRFLDRATVHEQPSAWLTEKIFEHGLKWVSVYQSPLSDPDEDPGEDAKKKAVVRKSYARVLGSIKDVARKLSANQSAGMRNSVRLVQKMVDIISADETFFLGISTIRLYDDYTYTHSVNVAILAMCLGKSIGLSHISLERLGLCGLFHDLGKVEIPIEILNKRGELREEEYNLLKTHTMHSARLILRLKAKCDRKNKILVPPFEHHMGYDNSGYPQARTGNRTSLFGRILTITDVYDAITSPRIYRKELLSPDKAIQKMMSGSGTHFDPILLKVFAEMMGVYPTGTLLKLVDGQFGIVIKRSRRDRARPIVQILEPNSGNEFRKGPILDLSKRNRQTGQFQHTIAESLHPSALGIQAAEFIL